MSVRYVVLYRGDHPYAGKYEGAGGSPQADLQKAQVFGWAKRAKEHLDRYRRFPEKYEVIPVAIVAELGELLG